MRYSGSRSKNPIAAWLFESIGVTTTGVVAVGVVTLAYVGLDALDRYERERRVVSGGLLGVMIAPVVWNLGVWVRLGTPALRSGSRRDARDRDRLDGCGHRRDQSGSG